MFELTNADEINEIVYGETSLDETHLETYNMVMNNERVNLGLPEEEC